MYNCYKVKKPKGGFRLITEPSEQIKPLLDDLKIILDRVPLHRAAHGFVENKSPITNAYLHRNQKYVLNIDIKSFFPSVPKEKMLNELWKYSYAIENFYEYEPWIEALCFFRGGLPQGSPTSPVLSNIYLTDIDYIFEAYASIFNGTYSRYADDITFSGGDFLKDNLDRILSFVSKELEKKSLKIHPKKVKLMPYYQCQKVTGIVVNNSRLTLPGKKKEEVFLSFKDRPYKDLDATELGYLEYVHSVDLKFYNKLMRFMV